MKNKAFLCAPRRFLIITVVYLLIQSVGIYLFFESLQYEEIGHLEAILNIIAPPAPCGSQPSSGGMTGCLS